MTLLELKERIEDAVVVFGAHPTVTFTPEQHSRYMPIKGVYFDICVNCDTDEEEVDIRFRT